MSVKFSLFSEISEDARRMFHGEESV